MLLYKLKEMECCLEKNKIRNEVLLKNVSKLKNLLLQIDFKVEEVQEYSFDKLIAVLEEIKGRKLTKRQKQLLWQLIKD